MPPKTLALNQIPPTTSKTKMVQAWIRLSMLSASARLPIPARVNSMFVCSGVSTLWLSSNMISNRWLNKRKAHWQRLEQLLDSAEHGLGNLSGQELQELGLLYRQTASDLSTVAEDRTSASFAGYLNRLLGRCHNFLYAGIPAEGNRLIRFFAIDYPRA